MGYDAGTADDGNRSRAKVWVIAGVVVIALALAVLLVYQVSRSAFTADTETGSSTFSATSIDLTNDKSGSSVFTATDLAPGDSDSGAVAVTYTGATDATVKMYTKDNDDTGLAPYLNLAITDDAGGSWNGTLADLQGATDFASGLLTHTMSDNDTTTFTIAYTLDSGAPNSVQGAGAATTFVWEARTG
ncbi:hypothetical protein [Glycomyces paridis]|uniref:Uncharacterized protein n=1 Tax=Glycomyces paridis TaxID=2126555 RepID=A0A4S8PJJ0_9ACTN|nr:hypothetical protein [Glycomyces paridis]THV30847.1 hypothetical protein E9998_05590 [Glycomyces paridis]